MPKKSYRKRRMGRYIRGNVDENLLLTSLAARALVKTPFDENVEDRCFVSSIVARFSMGDFTLGSDIGPIMVGVAKDDYTAAEIEAFIENTASWSEGDEIAQEIGKRRIKIVGVFPNVSTLGDNVLNDGKAIKVKLGWILNQGSTISLWAYNLGASPVATTVPDIHCQGHVNLWPR